MTIDKNWQKVRLVLIVEGRGYVGDACRGGHPDTGFAQQGPLVTLIPGSLKPITWPTFSTRLVACFSVINQSLNLLCSQTTTWKWFILLVDANKKTNKNNLPHNKSLLLKTTTMNLKKRDWQVESPFQPVASARSSGANQWFFTSVSKEKHYHWYVETIYLVGKKAEYNLKQSKANTFVEVTKKTAKLDLLDHPY